ncbi:MAG: S9 family peptidase [Chloroflexota bacterium]
MNSLTPETLVYGFTKAVDPQISPDGELVVYSRAIANRETKKNESQLWLCDRDGGNHRQLTQSGKRNTGARWSLDGKQIAFVSDRVEKSGIFVLDLAGGDPREITKHNSSIGDLAWSPDGSTLAYIADFDPDNPDEDKEDEDTAPKVRVTSRIDYKVDGLGYRGDVRRHLFVVDLGSGDRRRLTEDVQDYGAPAWSPDGTTIAVGRSAIDSDGSQLALVDVATGNMKLVGAEHGIVDQWAWSPDGKRLALSAEEGKTYQADLCIYDVEKDEIETIADDIEWKPGGRGGMEAPPQWIDDDKVLFLGAHKGGTVITVADANSGKVETLHRSESTPATMSVNQGGQFVARAHTSLETNGEIEILDIENKRGKVITDFSSEVLETTPQAHWERFEIERGDYTIESWLLKPVDFDESKKYPVVLDIHGGPNGYYGYNFDDHHQALAGAGFIVVYSNPRGSSSYGREFTMQVFQDWGFEDYKDLMAALDEALKRPYSDEERVGVRGYSYGGYMTSWIIGQTTRFQAAVCGAPCFDLESFWGTSDIGPRFGAVQFGAAPHEAPEWYAAHSPSNFAHRATTPTLIVHGEADERCPIGQGEQMFTALKKAGVETEFARYPGGAHGFTRLGPPEHRVDVLTRTVDWFKEHLGQAK